MIEEWLSQNLWLIVVFAIWEFAWKGIALWKAAKNDSKPWFVVLLIVNTAGILPLFYIFVQTKLDNKKS